MNQISSDKIIYIFELNMERVLDMLVRIYDAINCGFDDIVEIENY